MIHKQHMKPMLAALGVFAIWGFSFLASKLGQAVASPLVVLMYRFDLATLMMGLLWLYKKPKISLKGKKVKALLLLGLCEPVIYFIGEQYGLKFTNSAFTGVMIAVIPIVTMLLTAVFLKEKPSALQWLYSAISIAGVAAITLMAGGSGQIQPLGVALLTVAVFAGSAYSVISKSISDESSTYERSLVMQLMGAIFFTTLAVLENRNNLSALVTPMLDGGFIFAALYLSLGASVMGYLLFNYAVSHAPMANVISMSNLTTVLSVVAGVVLLNEPFALGSAVALAVILLGIWGVQKSG